MRDSTRGFKPSTNIPEALPIIDKKYKIQDPKAIKSRQIFYKKNYTEDQGKSATPSCKHEKIKEWQCTLCNQVLSKFEQKTDCFGGPSSLRCNLVYENDFINDFQQIAIPLAKYQRLTEPNKKVFVSNSAVNPGQKDGVTAFAAYASSKPDLEEEQSYQEKQEFIWYQSEAEIIYESYEPQNTQLMREYIQFLISQNIKQQDLGLLGTGAYTSLSSNLNKYLHNQRITRENVSRKHNNEALVFDSIFESGNLLAAELVTIQEYNLYMQVDTNTKGHQQWFYFRVRNTKKGRKYLFKIQNFTKPAKKNEHIRIYQKSKNQGNQWKTQTQNIQYVKTSVARKKRDVIAAAADSDQDELEHQHSAALNQEGGFEPIVAMLQTRQIEHKNSAKASVPRRTYYYYCLVFQVEFDEDDDEVFFAFSQPYEYSSIINLMLTHEKNAITQGAQQQNCNIRQTPYFGHLSQKIAELEIEEQKKQKQNTDIQHLSSQKTPTEQSPEQKQREELPEKGVLNQIQVNSSFLTCQFENQQYSLFYKRELLTRTISGLPVFIITIASDLRSHKKKPIVAITSRVHSGETPGSFVFQGILDYLMTPEASTLRKIYTFLLIPCLNPDGVVCGNYRSSLSGYDLNRQWLLPDEDLHPEIHFTKSYFQEDRTKKIYIYCDLHGHSKKKNSFFYGCNTAANGGFLSWTIVRLLPRILAKNSHMFNYKGCRFKVDSSKVGTGRVVMWKQLQVTHSFTLESSFYGYDYGDVDVKEFREQDYRSLGLKFCHSVEEMHVMWKQIHRELQITNGWLKPRRLNEFTGTPAAQIVNEEMQKKKKEENKARAIEEYQAYLKRYYQPVQRPMTQNTASIQGLAQNVRKQITLKNTKIVGQGGNQGNMSTSKKDLIGENSNTPTIDSSPPLKIPKRNVTKISDQKKPQLPPQQDFDLSHESLQKLLNGLIKIQSLIRGFLFRKNKDQFFENRKNLESDGSSYNFSQIKTKIKYSATGVTGNNQNNGSNSEEQSSDGFIKQSISQSSLSTDVNDWRNYFTNQELNTAYDKLEKVSEHVQEEDEDTESGSSSDPSGDNLDFQEIIAAVYSNPKLQQKAKKLKSEKKKLQTYFEVEVTHWRQQPDHFLNSMNSKFIKSSPEIQRRKTQNYGMNLLNNSEQTGSQTAQNFFTPCLNKASQGGVLELNGQQLQPNQIQNPPSLPYQNHTEAGGNGLCRNCQRQRSAKGNGGLNSTFSFNDQAYSGIHFAQQQRQAVHQQIRGGISQGECIQCGVELVDREPAQRNISFSHATSQQPQNPSNTQTNLSTVNMIHLRLIQNHNKQSGTTKKENINQVIKDCLTTKKFGPSSTNTSQSPEKKQKQILQLQKKKKEKKQQQPKSLLNYPVPQTASQGQKRQKIFSKNRENEKTAFTLSRKLAELDQEFSLVFNNLLREFQKSNQGGFEPNGAISIDENERVQQTQMVINLLLKYLGTKLASQGRGDKRATTQQAITQQYLISYQKLIKKTLLDKLSLDGQIDSNLIEFYSEIERQENRSSQRNTQMQQQLSSDQKGLQMHKLRALSPDHVGTKIQGKQQRALQEAIIRQKKGGPYFQAQIYNSPETRINTYYRNIATADNTQQQRLNYSSNEIDRGFDSSNSPDKTKLPNIAMMAGPIQTQSSHSQQKKEISATQLQLFPQNKQIGLQNYSLQASLVEEEFSKGRASSNNTNNIKGYRYENSGFRQTTGGTGSKTGKNNFQNNIFAQSYGFQEVMQNTQQDFSSLDRMMEQTKSQKQVKQKQGQKQGTGGGNYESPLLLKNFQEDQSVSLRIKDEEGGAIVQQQHPTSGLRQQKESNHQLQKRKTSIGKRTLNYSQIDQTRNNPAPYTSSSFFSSAQNALLNITSQSRQSSQQ